MTLAIMGWCDKLQTRVPQHGQMLSYINFKRNISAETEVKASMYCLVCTYLLKSFCHCKCIRNTHITHIFTVIQLYIHSSVTAHDFYRLQCYWSDRENYLNSIWMTGEEIYWNTEEWGCEEEEKGGKGYVTLLNKS